LPAVRLDSVVNATFGSIAIHVGLATLAWTLLVTRPYQPPPPPPKVELVNIEPVIVKPPEPAKEETPKQETPAPEPVKHPVQQRATKAVTRPATPPPMEQPPPTTTPSDDSGGAPVMTMEDIAPVGTGVMVAKGPTNTGRIGRGGTGGGTGSGTGTGSSDAPPTPVSVATI
jgi:outer membrane biosynthesis protein TonB